MKKFFEGYYFKHQKGADTIAFIVGISADHAFLQIITNTQSYYILYRLNEYRKNSHGIQLGGCRFSQKGITLDIQRSDITVKGKIRYDRLTPLQYDIMGVFRYLPMECSHRIVSLYHQLTGSITMNGKEIDFTDGTGYIEGDRGKSFPKSYIWLQCSDFKEKCCVTAACAGIPALFFTFTGCIAIVYYQNKEYRFATYLGVKIEEKTSKHLILKQGRYRLEVSVEPKGGKALMAPNLGKMSRGIRECAACCGRFRFYKDERLIFDMESENVSFEFVKAPLKTRERT